MKGLALLFSVLQELILTLAADNLNLAHSFLYSFMNLLSQFKASKRAKTPTQEPPNFALVVVFHLFEMKQTSSVYQFQSMLIVHDILIPLIELELAIPLIPPIFIEECMPFEVLIDIPCIPVIEDIEDIIVLTVVDAAIVLALDTVLIIPMVLISEISAI